MPAQAFRSVRCRRALNGRSNRSLRRRPRRPAHHVLSPAKSFSARRFILACTNFHGQLSINSQQHSTPQLPDPATRRTTMATTTDAIPSPTRLFWSGAVNSTAFSARAQVAPGETVLVSTDLTFPQAAIVRALPVSAANMTVSEDRDGVAFKGVNIAKIDVRKLRASTTYYLGVSGNGGGGKVTPIGRVATFPPENEPLSFQFAAGSCAKWQSDVGKTYGEIAGWNPLFMVQHGDLFYGDIATNDKALYKDQYMTVFKESAQLQFFANRPVFYIYDDHDFGPNNADASSSSKPAALWAYDAFTPHLPLQSDNGTPVGFQAFTVGRVRFIMTDLRSAATGSLAASPTVLGAAQRGWLLNELGNFQRYKLMVWVSTTPWSGAPDPGDDAWAGYPAERTQIADAMVSLGVNNLVMVAGDAHMLAIDDGTNTDFSTGGSGAGFPILQAGPLGNYGSAKGGAYTGGCHAYWYYPNYQYAMVSVSDSNTSTCVTFDGYTLGRVRVLDSFTRCLDATSNTLMATTRGDGTAKHCTIPWFPTWVWAVIVSFLVIALGIVGAVVWKLGDGRGWWDQFQPCTRRKRRMGGKHESTWDDEMALQTDPVLLGLAPPLAPPGAEEGAAGADKQK
ncbi:hypothetical protein AMAG_19940 [Allomyces macrogynus ATCC 38327]|uniref:PhoD-like phosphatase metallophosphatase domain-containing protein n=1 Tax=Allomyces macrogynus (strain ATCC 38327) TaxID=578462 RepID=A0A0L0T2T0_ALLM3|nr:hypothetical protein AMAG_19940 [Allomyces macrogynus ATCC 38327]|eukprot:KNE68992.1 hypothetical protein AMAG_19940 [Allomyces macrogynus ATCC 38327]